MERALEVHEIYSDIFALETPEQQHEALWRWWAFLNASCTAEKPCIECRQMAEQQD